MEPSRDIEPKIGRTTKILESVGNCGSGASLCDFSVGQFRKFVSSNFLEEIKMLRTIRAWISERRQQAITPSLGTNALLQAEIASLAGEDRVIDDAWRRLMEGAQH